jgi:hypothetical protein
MVKKSFDEIYASASKLASRRHSIVLSRSAAATGKFVAALPQPKRASKEKASSKVRG